ncbi:MAG: enolase C-terminal domain-like protein [Pseudomonadota bacterium]|nr:enolase C-terminal domain-like protein [Pseudomonadota bacterium]
MRILDIRERTVSLADPMRSAAIGFDDMTVSAVALVTDAVRGGENVVGYGFGSIGRYGQSGLLRERFIPRLLAADPETLADADGGNLDPFRVFDALMRNEKSGGHGERPAAVGVIDMAIWDAIAKADDSPLWSLLAEYYNPDGPDARVPVYASGGHYHPEGGVGGLTDELMSYLDLGYRRLKIKIGAAPMVEDLARVEAALSVVGSGDNLAVDLNASLDGTSANEWLDALAPYDLAWIEEPGDPLDFALQSSLCARYEGPLATGENLFSQADARNLIRHGGLRSDRDILQFDIALSYGLVEYMRILEMLAGQGWSRRQCLPHAGHLLSLHAAAGLGLGGHEAAPDPALSYGGFPDGTVVEDGFVTPPQAPGIGFETKANLWSILEPLGK